MKRGPYKLRATTLICARCGQKHKKNQCPKRVPLSVRQSMPKPPTKKERQEVATAIRLAAQKDARFQRRVALRETREQKDLQELVAHRKFLQRLEQEQEGPEQWARELVEMQAEAED